MTVSTSLTPAYTCPYSPGLLCWVCRAPEDDDDDDVDVRGIHTDRMCAFQRRTGAPNAADYSPYHQQQQHTSIRVDPRAELDEEVAMLGSSVSNLKFMARSINEEVKAQGTLIAQLVSLGFHECQRNAMSLCIYAHVFSPSLYSDDVHTNDNVPRRVHGCVCISRA